MNGILDEDEMKAIVEAATEVLRVGNGEVRIIIQNFAVLDVIASPRRRVKSEGTTQDAKKGRLGERL